MRKVAALHYSRIPKAAGSIDVNKIVIDVSKKSVEIISESEQGLHSAVGKIGSYNDLCAVYPNLVIGQARPHDCLIIPV